MPQEAIRPIDRELFIPLMNYLQNRTFDPCLVSGIINGTKMNGTTEDDVDVGHINQYRGVFWRVYVGNLLTRYALQEDSRLTRSRFTSGKTEDGISYMRNSGGSMMFWDKEGKRLSEVHSLYEFHMRSKVFPVIFHMQIKGRNSSSQNVVKKLEIVNSLYSEDPRPSTEPYYCKIRNSVEDGENGLHRSGPNYRKNRKIVIPNSPKLDDLAWELIQSMT